MGDMDSEIDGPDRGSLVWAGTDIDRSRANPARMYDYYLGGAHNFGSDRQLAEQALEAMPWMGAAVRANRGFLRRAVRWCADHGVRQFLDLGSGIPTVGNVHEVAHAIDPGSQVVYVDNDAVAVSHSERLLAHTPNVRVVHADLTKHDEVLTHPDVTAVLDFSEPVAVLALAVLHFVPALATARAVLAGYQTTMTSNSFLVFSHVTADHDPEPAHQAAAVYQRSASPVHPRSHAELTEMLAGFDLLPPGLVDATDWRPTGPHHRGEHAGFYAALARNPLPAPSAE